MKPQVPHARRETYMLAFDHRQVLRDLYPEADTRDLETMKLVVLDALQVVADTVTAVKKNSLGFLVDEEYGGAAARLARERGLYVAMPVEASRTKILRLQYPDDYRERFERFDPQCAKALVFHNPADNAARKRTQLNLLREIGEFCREQQRDYLLEVLINPTPEQLAESGGPASFRRNTFPRLLIESIAEMQEDGIEPDFWKIEGMETVEDCVAVGAQATSGGRDGVRCIVLGSGESQDKVTAWLAHASEVPAFSGFAIGRTVWHRPLGDMLAGLISGADAVNAMARSFAELIAVFGREHAAISLEA